MSTGFAAAGPVTSPPAPSSALLRITGVSKTFPGTKALDDVSMDVAPGEIHALVGQNGSGKSTLIKVLAGYHQADPGAKAWINDEPVDLASASEHRHHRLRFVHQDLGLFQELSVVDNLALRSEFITDPLRRIRWRAQAGDGARADRPVRAGPGPEPPGRGGDPGAAHRRRHRGRARRLGGRPRAAGTGRADRRAASARRGPAAGNHQGRPGARHQHPVCLAPAGRGVAPRRPGDRAARWPGGGDQAGRRPGRAGAGRAHGRLGRRCWVPGRARQCPPTGRSCCARATCAAASWPASTWSCARARCWG